MIESRPVESIVSLTLEKVLPKIPHNFSRDHIKSTSSDVKFS
jgi:hypothetical protein